MKHPDGETLQIGHWGHSPTIRTRLFGHKTRWEIGCPPKCAMMPIRGNL